MDFIQTIILPIQTLFGVDSFTAREHENLVYKDQSDWIQSYITYYAKCIQMKTGVMQHIWNKGSPAPISFVASLLLQTGWKEKSIWYENKYWRFSSSYTFCIDSLQRIFCCDNGSCYSSGLTMLTGYMMWYGLLIQTVISHT